MNNKSKQKVNQYPQSGWLFCLAAVSFLIATPNIKNSIGLLGILLFFLITIFIQIMFKKGNTLFLAWVSLSPTMGQGIFIGTLTLSVIDIIAISYLIRGNMGYMNLSNKISKGYLIFIILIIISYLINPKLSSNASIYKELLILTVMFKYSTQKHAFDDWIAIVKSLQLAAFSGILLYFRELLTMDVIDGNIFRVSSINAIHQYISIGIISYIYTRYKKSRLISPLFIIGYSVFVILSLSRTGIIYLILVLLFYIYSWFKIRKINFYSFLPFVIGFLLLSSYFGISYMLSIGQARDQSNIERLGVIIYYLNLIQSNLWWGIGFGNWQQSLLLLQEDLFITTSIDGVSSTLNPHNTFLRLLTDTGLFATISFVYIFFICYQSSRKNEKIFHKTKVFTSTLFIILFLTFFVADNTENIHFWACLGLGSISYLNDNPMKH